MLGHLTYTMLDVETRTIVTKGQANKMHLSEKNPSSPNGDGVRSFWDGGLLANTPLRQTVIAHRHYWYRVRKSVDNIPKLKFGIINLHPAKQQYLSSDYDSVVDRKNDIIYYDRTEFDEFVATILSDYTSLAESLIKLAEEKGASKEEIQKILNEQIKRQKSK